MVLSVTSRAEDLGPHAKGKALAEGREAGRLRARAWRGGGGVRVGFRCWWLFFESEVRRSHLRPRRSHISWFQPSRWGERRRYILRRENCLRRCMYCGLKGLGLGAGSWFCQSSAYNSVLAPVSNKMKLARNCHRLEAILREKTCGARRAPGSSLATTELLARVHLAQPLTK